jgi:hypothetical protein
MPALAPRYIQSTVDASIVPFIEAHFIDEMMVTDEYRAGDLTTSSGVSHMRLDTALYLAGLVVVATPLLSATVLSAPATHNATIRSNMAVLVDDRCPPGTHWEDAGYVAEGKWRDAHCAKDGGRE